MRIVIDLQGAQCENRQRGIGRYSLSLTQAIIRNRGSHDIIVVLNGLFPDTIEPIRAQLNHLLPQEQIRIWHAPNNIRHIEQANTWRRKSAELIREQFLVSLRPDVVYVTSLFEGLVDDAVTSIGLFTQAVPTAVTLYDLIPFINRKPYLANPAVEKWYECKLDHLRRANLVLAISESSRQEGIRYLGFSPDKIVNISTAADSQFQAIDVDSEKESVIRTRYGLNQPFIMYTGGIDFRKNIEGLIRAFAMLPKSISSSHQLAIVCSIQPKSRRTLESLIKQHGLSKHQVVLTGFVPEDDLITLYRLCKAFVFPSWHEGFGLPALEAMACGAPVIAANSSSLPEVVGRSEALFEAKDDTAIAEKLLQTLSDNNFRAKLIHDGLIQANKFSWDKCAQSTITALEQLHTTHSAQDKAVFLPRRRPTLAYISPLPPERSGISDYSAELLPELARYYEIEVIVAQKTITDPWINANCKIRDVAWFEAHSDYYDRVLYHFGNSHYHEHMFELLLKVPGVVVLHDFFLSGIVAHMDVHGMNPNVWARELYHAHGYPAVQQRFHAGDTADVVWKYPCNRTITENAQGVIVHSEHSMQLARQWLGEFFAYDWSVIPLLRVPAIVAPRAELSKTRKLLGFQEDAFIVCSFGAVSITKQHHRILDAWLASSLPKDSTCYLVFVGEVHGNDYGKKITATIKRSGHANQIRVTQWLDKDEFQHYLTIADVAVQLRTHSRGETSAAVLDCMNYGIPTIVNRHGSMADLPSDCVWMLPDTFSEAELTLAMETLWREKNKRLALSERSKELISSHHAPGTCADQYAEAIEQYYENVQRGDSGLIKTIAKLDGIADDNHWLDLAKNMACNVTPLTEKQLLVDISELVQRDAKTGIQRVVHNVITTLLTEPPVGYRVEPIYALPGESGYRYARQFTLQYLNCPNQLLLDDPVEVFSNDIFLGLDLQPQIIPEQAEFYASLRRLGAHIYFVVYDLLPVKLPHAFSKGADAMFTKWLNTIAQADGLLCISRAVCDEMRDWLAIHQPERLRPINLGWFHLGANIDEPCSDKNVPVDAQQVLRACSDRPAFLMVGTIEPRKGQMQTLAAFNKLWKQGVDVNLVLVGKQGWMMDAFVAELKKHPERNQRLFWLTGINDAYLEKVYEVSTCLIAASEGEGFGLPLIEAARRNLPIIAHDIPVFREVAGDFAFYFSELTPDVIADCVKDWLTMHEIRSVPQSGEISWLSWKKSTQQLLDVILNNKWYQQWMPGQGLLASIELQHDHDQPEFCHPHESGNPVV